MPELKLENKFQNILNDFTKGMQGLYQDNLVSVILYGSAASGEFIKHHSNLNLLVILKNTDLEKLKIASGLINKWKFRTIHPLFFSEDYIKSSNDVFPIEFLDMKENYMVLAGKDVLRDVSIDASNLRFQCEQELKVKLISLKQLFLIRYKDKTALSDLLFKSFNSILHILRNVIRLKGKQPPYLKRDILKEISSDFKINREPWEKILAAKNKQIKLNNIETEQLFINFVRDLENIVNLVDRF